MTYNFDIRLNDARISSVFLARASASIQLVLSLFFSKLECYALNLLFHQKSDTLRHYMTYNFDIRLNDARISSVFLAKASASIQLVLSLLFLFF